MARLQDRYRKEVVPRLQKQLEQKNRHAIPRVTKVVVNMGVGAATQDRKRLEEAERRLKPDNRGDALDQAVRRVANSPNAITSKRSKGSGG